MRKAPRYLKEDVKWILFLLVFSMMSGISDSVCFFAWVRVEGKNIASVLDLCLVFRHAFEVQSSQGGHESVELFVLLCVG